MVIEENVPLNNHTTFRVGGPARFFAVARSREELWALITHAKDKNLPLLIMGTGSNILAPDEGWKGLVIEVGIMGKQFSDQPDGTILATAGAGENWDSLVADCVSKGFWGLENLSGIPGTVGATPIQNVGAYGVEIKDVIDTVEVLEIKNGETHSFIPTDCRFGYRDSFFKQEPGRYVVTAVTMRLSRNAAPTLHYRDLREHFKNHKETPSLLDIRTAVLEIRSRKFPDLRKFGTAGSFFKNPIITTTHLAKLQERFPDVPHFPAGEGREKISLAWLLDRVCNLKGVTHGPVESFKRQPLVIVNTGGATAKDIRAFADFVASCVKEKTGIAIEPEVNVLS